MTTASVELWGRRIGAVTWDADRRVGIFEYAKDFVGSGIEVSPLMMPLRRGTYRFPELPYTSFKGLPGLLADSLPDKFGNALIDVWLAGQNRSAESFNPVERLCYTGTRGMGALEFQPAIRSAESASEQVAIARLVDLSNTILRDREALQGNIGNETDKEALETILRVGTSAGGARAKAILAWNASTGEFRSGQLGAMDGFTQWLIKFDGVDENRDKELNDPLGFGGIEYAYYLMALDAGITMMPSRLHSEGGRAHFMTKRFDRTDTGEKLHYQSFGAMMHYDFNNPGAYSYAQVIMAMKQLQMPMRDIEEQVKRAYFNVIARNQDDHVKNIGFVMNKQGQWRLSPAFDVAYSYNPSGAWTSRHQMSINGKRDNFERDDLIALAKVGGVKRMKAIRMINEVRDAAGEWSTYADKAGVFDHHKASIASTLRIKDFRPSNNHSQRPKG